MNTQTKPAEAARHTPSAGAMRATRALQREKVHRLLAGEEFLTQEEIAELIDRETSAPETKRQRDELLAALKGLTAAYSIQPTGRPNRFALAKDAARRAIANAERSAQ